MTFFFWNISIILSYSSGSSEFIEHETGHSLLCSLKQDCPFDRDVIFIIPIRKIIQYHNGIHMWKQLPLIVPEAVFRCNFIHKIMVKRRKFLLRWNQTSKEIYKTGVYFFPCVLLMNTLFFSLNVNEKINYRWCISSILLREPAKTKANKILDTIN